MTALFKSMRDDCIVHKLRPAFEIVGEIQIFMCNCSINFVSKSLQTCICKLLYMW
jgi:hypothetical protein